VTTALASRWESTDALARRHAALREKLSRRMTTTTTTTTTTTASDDDDGDGDDGAPRAASALDLTAARARVASLHGAARRLEADVARERETVEALRRANARRAAALRDAATATAKARDAALSFIRAHIASRPPPHDIPCHHSLTNHERPCRRPCPCHQMRAAALDAALPDVRRVLALNAVVARRRLTLERGKVFARLKEVIPIAAVGDVPGGGGGDGRGRRGRRNVNRRDAAAAAAAATAETAPTAIRVASALRVPDPGDARPLRDHVELAAGLGALLRFVDLAASYACAPTLHRGTARGASRSEVWTARSFWDDEPIAIDGRRDKLPLYLPREAAIAREAEAGGGGGKPVGMDARGSGSGGARHGTGGGPRPRGGAVVGVGVGVGVCAAARGVRESLAAVAEKLSSRVLLRAGAGAGAAPPRSMDVPAPATPPATDVEDAAFYASPEDAAAAAAAARARAELHRGIALVRRSAACVASETARGFEIEVPDEWGPFASLAYVVSVAARTTVRLLPIRPRSRGARRFLRTFPVVALHLRFPFNV
jgi:hypothetical protein